MIVIMMATDRDVCAGDSVEIVTTSSRLPARPTDYELPQQDQWVQSLFRDIQLPNRLLKHSQVTVKWSKLLEARVGGVVVVVGRPLPLLAVLADDEKTDREPGPVRPPSPRPR